VILLILLLFLGFFGRLMFYLRSINHQFKALVEAKFN